MNKYNCSKYNKNNIKIKRNKRKCCSDDSDSDNECDIYFGRKVFKPDEPCIINLVPLMPLNILVMCTKRKITKVAILSVSTNQNDLT